MPSLPVAALLPVVLLIGLASPSLSAADAVVPTGKIDKTGAKKPAVVVPKLQAKDLIDQGKEAQLAFTAQKSKRYEPLVTAATNYELARRLLVSDPDETLVQIAQEGLFWCKKQMNGPAVQAFTAQVAARPQKFSKTPIPAKRLPTDPPPPADPVWQRRLQDLVRSHLAARKPLTVGTDPAFIAPKVIKIAEDAELTVRFDTGDPEPRVWAELPVNDLAGLALQVTRDDRPDNHAVAAYFLMRAGDVCGAHLRLDQAADRAREVEKALNGK